MLALAVLGVALAFLALGSSVVELPESIQIGLFVVGCVLAVASPVLHKPIRDRYLPQVSIKPPPARPKSKRKLKTDTMELVKEIRGYVTETLPRARAEEDVERRAMEVAMPPGAPDANDEEQSRIWHEYTRGMHARSDRQRAELAALFGGRVAYVLSEYERRNMIEGKDVRYTQWHCGSLHHITEAANRLEALARRL